MDLMDIECCMMHVDLRIAYLDARYISIDVMGEDGFLMDELNVDGL